MPILLRYFSISKYSYLFCFIQSILLIFNQAALCLLKVQAPLWPKFLINAWGWQLLFSGYRVCFYDTIFRPKSRLLNLIYCAILIGPKIRPQIAKGPPAFTFSHCLNIFFSLNLCSFSFDFVNFSIASMNRNYVYCSFWATNLIMEAPKFLDVRCSQRHL